MVQKLHAVEKLPSFLYIEIISTYCLYFAMIDPYVHVSYVLIKLLLPKIIYDKQDKMWHLVPQSTRHVAEEHLNEVVVPKINLI